MRTQTKFGPNHEGMGSKSNLNVRSGSVAVQSDDGGNEYI